MAQMGQTNGLANLQRGRHSTAGAGRDRAGAASGWRGGRYGECRGRDAGRDDGWQDLADREAGAGRWRRTGGRGGGGGGGGGFSGFNPTQPHGAIFYQGGNGALNAAPFSSRLWERRAGGEACVMQNRFGVSFTGSPSIPGLVKASTKQFVFLNVTGQRNINPRSLNGTVPTLAERGGDFFRTDSDGRWSYESGTVI